MNEPKAPFGLRFIHSALGLLATTPIQGAVCLTVGGILTYAAILAGRPLHELPLLLLVGMAVPLWPLRVYYSPERIFERKFSTWDRWVKAGMLSEGKCLQWKAQLRNWYTSEAVKPPKAASQTGMLPLGDDD